MFQRLLKILFTKSGAYQIFKSGSDPNKTARLASSWSTVSKNKTNLDVIDRQSPKFSIFLGAVETRSEVVQS